jgi:SAM-dependent methyltransferase
VADPDVDREGWLRRFHDARPGITAAGLARTDSYDQLAATALAGAAPGRAGGPRVLDLGSGDGLLAARIAARGGRAIAVDVSRGELRLARGRGVPAVAGRARALPFAAAAFDAVACHLAFMLFDDAAAAVAELERVIAPGGRFAAVLGGGPTAAPPGPAAATAALPGPAAATAAPDAFHAFLAVAGPRLAGPRLGDPRARSEAGWSALFGAGWSRPRFERRELDLSGTLDEVWGFLGASYQLPGSAAGDVRAALAAALEGAPGARVPCRVVTWLASVDRRPAGSRAAP